MSLFSKLLKKNKTQEPKNQSFSSESHHFSPRIQSTVPEILELEELNELIESFLDCSHYVAKSEFRGTLPKYQKTVEFFEILKSSGMLEAFCHKNGTSEKFASGICAKYRRLDTLVDEQNERYI